MSQKKREKQLRARNKALARKKRQRQPKPSAPPATPFMPGMPPFMGGFEEPEAPKGFRPISATQAMLEFAGPVMEFVNDGTVKDPNEALQIAVEIWNFTLPKVPPEQKTPRPEMVKRIRKTLKMNAQEAEEFFDRMVQRKDFLFPEEIQPEGFMTMFMRKEIDYIITKFDESQLEISEEPIPPTQADQLLLGELRQMDKYIEEGEDYEEWEDHFFAMQEVCCERYFQWLKAKGVPSEYGQHFPFCVQSYLDFLYLYDEGELQDPSPYAIEEFFMDYLMRKVMAKPPEYSHWPPALRLFYKFLSEIGYLNDPEPMIEMLEDLEPDFIEWVKKRS